MSETLESVIAKIPGKSKVVINRGDKIIILFTRDLEEGNNFFVEWNIVAIDNTPKIIWRANPSQDALIEGDIVFTSVYIGDDNKLMAYGGSGYDYVIDESNGQVSRWHDPSWPPGYKPRPW
jgi:hypothetical protein